MKVKVIEKNGKWRVHFVANNNEIVAWTENYNDKRDALKAIELVKEISNAEIVEVKE